MNPAPLHILTGPTAVGKTQRALELANELGAEILSCDASLVYRGMDIGTAKPTPAEQAAVVHHGIDIVGATESFNIVQYVKYAQGVVRSASQRGLPLVITGGSGFYLKSFFAPVADAVNVPAAIKSAVAALSAPEQLQQLKALHAHVPQPLSDVLHTENPRRVSSALQRCLASGQTIPELKAAFAALPEPYAQHPKKITVLMRPRETLHARIAQRTAAMLQAGLVDEVRALQAAGFESNAPAASAIGYRQTLQWLASGEAGGTQGLQRSINTATNTLVRKQCTWFKNQMPAHTQHICVD